MLKDIKRIDKEHYGNKKRFENILEYSFLISVDKIKRLLREQIPSTKKQVSREIKETKKILKIIGKHYYHFLTGQEAVDNQMETETRRFLTKIRNNEVVKKIILKNPLFSNISFCNHCRAVILKDTPSIDYLGVRAIKTGGKGGIKDGLYEDSCLICHDCTTGSFYVRLSEYNDITLFCYKEDIIKTYDSNRVHSKAFARTFLYKSMGEYFTSKELGGRYRATFNEDVIKSYHSKDQTTEQFFKFATEKNREASKEYNNGILYGIELEVEVDEDIIKKDECARRFLTYNDASKIWIEQDGSLDDGFEIITYPMPYKKLAEFINSIRVIKGMSSFNKKTTGVHIHCEAENIDKEQIVNYRAFINKTTNRIFINYIAMRVNNQFSEYKNQSKKVISHNIEQGNESRYDSVNIRRGSRTIETRIFKGNLRRESLMVYLQFTSALLDYCGVSQKQSISGFAKHVKLKNGYYPQLWKRVKEFTHWKDQVIHKQVEKALEQELAAIYEN